MHGLFFKLHLSMLHLSFNFRFGSEGKTSRAIDACIFIEDAVKAVSLSLTERSASTRKNYITALNSFRAFSHECQNCVMTDDTMQRYQQWLAAKGKNRNTCSCYVRSLRSLHNKIYPGMEPPFGSVFTGCTRTRKRALNKDDIILMAMNPPLTASPLRLWYDVFMFSVLGMGIPFVDLVHLTHDNLQGDVIVYKRHKTSQQIIVPVVGEMAEIMSRYSRLSNDGLLFPLLKHRVSTYSEYQNLLARYNRALVKLSVKYNLPCKLTSYVARHTWASLANASGINLKHISQALGHSSVKTTEIYLECLSSSVMHKNSRIVANLLYSKAE